MIERPLALVLLLAPFAYIGGLVLPAFPGSDVGVTFAVAVCLLAAILSGTWIPRIRWAEAWTLLALVVVILVTLADPALFGSLGDDLTVGLFIGIPVILVVFVWRSGESLGVRVAAYGLSLTWGAILLTARESLIASGSTFTGATFSSTFYGVIGDQVTGLVGLITGSGYVALPIHATFDLVYAALTGASVLGLLLLFVRPQTGLGTPLPVSSRSPRDEGAGRGMSQTHGFSVAQRALFLDRSVSEPAPTTWPPGLLPVVCGAGATSAFLLLAVLTPRWALLSAIAAALVVAAGLILVAEMPGSVSWLLLRVRRFRRPPAPPRHLNASEGAVPKDEPRELPRSASP